jgi:hypothetical protein
VFGREAEWHVDCSSCGCVPSLAAKQHALIGGPFVMSSKSSMRIVLVDPLGDILFSGESLSVREGEPPGRNAAPRAAEVTTERCPETLRSAVSSESGVYRTLDRSRSSDLETDEFPSDDSPPTVDAPVIEDTGTQIRHVSGGRGGRAA